MNMSTGPADTGSNRCTVSRGRWNDPYTGKIFYEARDLDVDHLVPLKWAWDHGASNWSAEQRRKFANDDANLFAVEASVNREKGALGPLNWLPPDRSFHCQYILRFTRIVRKYSLVLSNGENDAMQRLRHDTCG
ncbi:HNH endonuclease family protein [Marinobacterium rhizophilum]|uniref:HNH endonuclease family protein n=1 Tax=Marinobacterium rhizophilum TaxID=420402 RepID=UPI00037A5245|nr:HNH endonuclease family protein [Marinobacterium rhizophilum]